MDVLRELFESMEQSNAWRRDARCQPFMAERDPSDIVLLVARKKDPTDDELTKAAAAVLDTRSAWWGATRQSGPRHPLMTREQMQQAALMVCSMCPAQWDCVTYAIELEERCTWAATEADREALAQLPNWKARVERARASGTPVQVMIKRAVSRVTA